MKETSLKDLKRDFIVALRIISHQGLSDAFAISAPESTEVKR